MKRLWITFVALALGGVLWARLPLADFGHPDLSVDLQASLVLSQDTWGIPLVEANRLALEARITPDDFAVAAFLSRQSGVGIEAVWRSRAGGGSWFDVALNYGVPMDTLIIRPTRDYGPPYGKAWGYWKNHPKKGDKSFRLDDNDIIRIVEVQTLCRSTGKSADDIIQGLQAGDSFTKWAGKVAREKHGKNAGAQGQGKSQGPSSSGGQKHQGQGKDKGQGQGKGK